MADQTWKEILPHEVADKIAREEAASIIDVREPQEWMTGHIPGAKHIPLSQLPARIEELDRNDEYVVVCRSGSRSARACEYLAARGYRVINMIGGMFEWTGPVVYGT